MSLWYHHLWVHVFGLGKVHVVNHSVASACVAPTVDQRWLWICLIWHRALLGTLVRKHLQVYCHKPWTLNCTCTVYIFSTLGRRDISLELCYQYLRISYLSKNWCGHTTLRSIRVCSTAATKTMSTYAWLSLSNQIYKLVFSQLHLHGQSFQLAELLLEKCLWDNIVHVYLSTDSCSRLPGMGWRSGSRMLLSWHSSFMKEGE